MYKAVTYIPKIMALQQYMCLVMTGHATSVIILKMPILSFVCAPHYN